jgi:hypothetical protein
MPNFYDAVALTLVRALRIPVEKISELPKLDQ